MIGKFVKTFFGKPKKKKDRKLNKTTSEVEGLDIQDPFEVVNYKTEFYEIEVFEKYDPQIVIDEYMNCLSQRSTTSSSCNPEDLIPHDKLRANITPDDFEYIKVIGKGYFGKVTQVKYKKDGAIYALKSLKKSKLKEPKHVEHTKTERKILEIVHFPFIVTLRFAFQTEKKLYFVMDCHNGGELFYHLRSKGRFNEHEARFYLSQIVLTLEFLHSKKIIYRDIKPENIVLDASGYIKLTDFGLAKENIPEIYGCTQTFCGTPEYLAPEIIRGDKYGKGVDIWCMGILLYEMLFGFPPFYDKNKDKLYKKTIFNEPDFTKNLAVKLSYEAKDLILRLLDKNQKTRIKMAQIKQHAFFEGIDFKLVMEMKYKPPIIPELKGKDDYKYIDPGLANEKPEDSVYNGCSPLVMKEFKDFTYASNFNLNEK